MTEVEKSEVEKWAEGKHPLLAASSIMWASYVDITYELFRQLKERTTLGYRFEITDFDSWFALYHSENKVLEMIIAMLSRIPPKKGAPPDFNNNIEFVARSMTGSVNSNIPKPLDLSNPDERNKLFQEMLIVQVNKIKQECSGKPIDPPDITIIKDYIDANGTETGFFILVIFPCMVLYQTLPLFLYRNALNGDEDALGKLLRLDWRLLSDKGIAKRLDSIHAESLTKHNKLIKDSLELPKPKINRKRVLNAIAGYISASAIIMDQSLTEPDIRELFDSISRDKHGVDDEDIPLAPDSFYQRIRQIRDNWLEFFDAIKPDK